MIGLFCRLGRNNELSVAVLVVELGNVVGLFKVVFSFLFSCFVDLRGPLRCCVCSNCTENEPAFCIVPVYFAVPPGLSLSATLIIGSKLFLVNV